MKLKVPKLRRQTFETAIIERYQRRESSVEEALIEMYLAGVSVRRVEDITEALWGTRVSPGTVSNLNKKIYARIEEWRHRPIEGDHPHVFLDGIVMKRFAMDAAIGPRPMADGLARCAMSRCWWPSALPPTATGRPSLSALLLAQTHAGQRGIVEGPN